MVDAARLRDLLTRIESRVARLESYGQRSQEEFTADEEGTAAAKYFLLTAIEDALAVANHIIAAEGYRGPADYADAKLPPVIVGTVRFGTPDPACARNPAASRRA